MLSATSQALPDSPIVTAAHRQWLDWRPRYVGVIAMVVFLAPSLSAIWNLHERSRQILSDAIKAELISAAQVLAMTVDPDVHNSFKDRAQEEGEAYRQQIARLLQARPAIDPKGMIKFVYTCVKKDGGIFFILDDSPAGDADEDGVDDKSHIMEHYDDAPEDLLRVFMSGTPAVNRDSYSDKWGTFLSGYAPIYDASRRLVGVVGVDMELSDYELQLLSLRNLSIVSAFGLAFASVIVGMVMGLYHRRLQQSMRNIVGMSEAAVAATRAKSDFLATMSHELRTPLHAIVGHSELLQGTSLSATQHDYSSSIQQSAEKLEEMITDILDYTEVKGGLAIETKPLNLRQFFLSLVEIYREEAASRNLQFGLRIDPSVPSLVMTDPVRLRQVLRHLLGNALKFIARGEISVEVERTGQDGIRIAVRDTGIGMSQEKLKKLFEPFGLGDASATRKHGGMGMGLALCQRICAAMDGRISAVSSPSAGTTFEVILPMPEAPAPTDVWLVTKDNLISVLVRRVAEKLGRRVHVVSTLENVKGNPAEPVMVDAPSILSRNPPDRRMIALNVDPSGTFSGKFHVILPAPVKPSDLRKVLEA